MNTKFLKAFSLLMVAGMFAAACSPAATATTAPTSAAASSVAAPASSSMAASSAPAATATSASSIDCKGAKSGDTLTVFYQWSGAEEESFNTIVKPFEDACGIKITAQSSRDAAVLDTAVKSTPPDVLFWPNLSPLKLYTDKLLPLDTVGADTSNYAAFWATMGSANGKLLALPAKADIKTIIWYSPAQFQALGYTVPTTWDDLNTLVEKMVADGNVPWSMGFGSDAATGWTGSDFVQDILLAQQGPDYVNKIISGATPYNDAGVAQAYTIYQKWASNPKYTVGGSTGTVNTKFLDAVYLPFGNPAKAMMVKQSGFAGAEIVKQFPTLKYGTDYDFFEFPGAKGLQGGADFMYAFSNSPAAQALIAYVTSAQGGQAWAKAGFSTSPNKGATCDLYTDPSGQKFCTMLSTASGFTFDIGDAIGDPFSTAEWKALIAVVQGGDIKAALDTVAAAQAQTLKK